MQHLSGTVKLTSRKIIKIMAQPNECLRNSIKGLVTPALIPNEFIMINVNKINVMAMNNGLAIILKCCHWIYKSS